jgi:hypothetical protein
MTKPSFFANFAKIDDVQNKQAFGSIATRSFLLLCFLLCFLLCCFLFSFLN